MSRELAIVRIKEICARMREISEKFRRKDKLTAEDRKNYNDECKTALSEIISNAERL